MAKDDYFVLAYRVLKYLYECFKAGERAEMEEFSPSVLGINGGYWVNLMESLSIEGYITGITFPSAIGAPKSPKVQNLKITEKGILFLQENSTIQKAADFLRSVKETVPLI